MEYKDKQIKLILILDYCWILSMGRIIIINHCKNSESEEEKSFINIEKCWHKTDYNYNTCYPYLYAQHKTFTRDTKTIYDGYLFSLVKK